MTSIRQQKKKAAKLAEKNARKSAAQNPGEGEDTPETETAENEAPAQTSQFAKDPLAGISTEDSDIKPLPLQTAPKNEESAPETKKPEYQEQPELETPEERIARRKKCSDFLNEAWEIRNIDPLLQDTLQEADRKKDKKYGEMICMTLKNGHQIGCYDNFAGQGYEFIGVTGEKAALDEDDARAVIAAAKSKGWEKIKLHGTAEDKNKLWLEAMRQGVETSYSPPEGSAVLTTWEKEYESIVDKNAAGVREEKNIAPKETPAPEAKTETPAAPVTSKFAAPKEESAKPAAKTPAAPAKAALRKHGKHRRNAHP